MGPLLSGAQRNLLDRARALNPAAPVHAPGTAAWDRWDRLVCRVSSLSRDAGCDAELLSAARAEADAAAMDVDRAVELARSA